MFLLLKVPSKTFDNLIRKLTMSRKYDVPIDFSAYKDWRLQHHNPSLNTNRTTSNGISTTEADRSHTTTTAQSSTNPPAPYPPTFTQIVDLITTGQPIPGIKDIPDIVLAGQETQPTTAKRKKPWEKDSVDVVADGNRDDLGAEPL